MLSLSSKMAQALDDTAAMHRSLLQFRGKSMAIEFEPVTHTYRVDGRRVPSVTQVLASQNDWSHINALVLEAKAQLGRDVHHALHLLAHGHLDWRSLDGAVAPYVRSGQRFLHEYGRGGITVLGAEVPVASRTLGVAGTLDLYGHATLDDGPPTRSRWRTYEVFVDWKIAEVMPSTVGAQLAAYQKLYDETFRPRSKARFATKRLCVRLSPDGYKVARLEDWHSDYTLFVSCFNAFIARERKSYG